MSRLPVVRDYMDLEVATVTPDMEIFTAINFLISHHVTGAPVVDAQGVVVGILTERDCLRLLALGDEGDVAKGTVGDYMTKDPVTLRPDTNIYYAAGVFLSHSFRRLPIVDGGRLVGAITRFDLVRAVSENRQLVAGA
jgi:CBS domain-containing protein